MTVVGVVSGRVHPTSIAEDEEPFDFRWMAADGIGATASLVVPEPSRARAATRARARRLPQQHNPQAHSDF